MLVEVEVQSLGMDRTTRSPVVVLRERGGDRVLPIWIGAAEASAIAMHLAGVDFPRPLTHDLVRSILTALDTTLLRVEVPRVDEGTYHASLVLRRGTDAVRVDARPSDSIAIAIRTGSTIVVADDLLRHMDLQVDEGEGTLTSPEVVQEVDLSGDAASSPLTAQDLADYLRKLDPEDFGRFTP
ncbi:bifunctional nuclease family protein [Gaopeijia maritima]|uniref:Bifunctional nuclease family protein n=1 Tax=Gaopeijia maritima TaxID=3119007 RepID=A0ABU9E8Y9_9BACT